MQSQQTQCSRLSSQMFALILLCFPVIASSPWRLLLMSDNAEEQLINWQGQDFLGFLGQSSVKQA